MANLGFIWYKLSHQFAYLYYGLHLQVQMLQIILLQTVPVIGDDFFTDVV